MERGTLNSDKLTITFTGKLYDDNFFKTIMYSRNYKVWPQKVKSLKCSHKYLTWETVGGYLQPLNIKGILDGIHIFYKKEVNIFDNLFLEPNVILTNYLGNENLISTFI